MMGCNFYWIPQDKVCPTCGHNPSDRLHIGKSSYGWVFALHIIPEKGINTLYDWIRRMLEPESEIRDEYGHPHTVENMLGIIMARGDYMAGGGELKRASPSHFSVAGEGTWDYDTGDFS